MKNWRPKYLFGLLSLMILMATPGCNRPKNYPDDVKEDGFKGKVKSVKVETWLADGDSAVSSMKFGLIPESIGEGYVPSKISYASDGHRLDLVFYDKENNPNERMECYYNHGGYLTKVVGYDKMGNHEYEEIRKDFLRLNKRIDTLAGYL